MNRNRKVDTPRGFMLTLLMVPLLLWLLPVPAFATDAKPVYLDRRAEVVLPLRYNRSTEYPVFVVLPPTGLEASRVAQ